jgi:hypothetical protein
MLLYLILFVMISLILTLLMLSFSDGMDEVANGGECIDVKWSFDEDRMFFVSLYF